MTKVAIIGCGYWGPNHVRAFLSIEDCAVVAIADANDTRLNAMAGVFPGIAQFNDYRELLSRSDAEAVVVATPTKTHYAIVSDALNAGKHVLCEKPLCTDTEDASQLVELAQSKQRVLMVGHIFLFNPGLLKVKELIDAGEIGTVRSLFAVRTNLGPVRSDVNAAWDLASHDVSIVNWLLGTEPEDVQAMGAAFLQPNVEDVVNISMKHPGNILASIHCSWLDPKKVRRMTIVGSRRMITWDDLELSNPVAVYEKAIETNTEVTDYGEFLRLSMHDGDVRLPKVQTGEPLKLQENSEFISAINQNRVPRSDGEFSVGVVRVLERVAECVASSHGVSLRIFEGTKAA